MSIPAGSRLGPYEILGPLGAGGMGEVHRARDTRLGREVAIKVLPEGLSGDRERLARLDREARSASALNHPNVVTIYEVGREGAVSYIAMELVAGQTVGAIMASGPLPLRRVLHIGAQVADGLAKAHGAGVIHRDLKPENLMLSDDGFVKILDFGLARFDPAVPSSTSNVATLDPVMTGAGVVLGTLAYMSPEQAAGHPADFRSDQFSLGAVLYEMATGRSPFRRETAAETLVAVLRDEPEPIGSVNPRLPAPFCWIVERCLAKEPKNRYASTRDLAQDLSAVQERFLEAPAAARDARPSNLPIPRTGFVGRGRELTELEALLSRPDAYLVTLTGPGGIGKTRLALEVARAVAGRFGGGVTFVALANVTDSEWIVPAICQALGVPEGGTGGGAAALKDYLQNSLSAPMLLLLDSFEHLISASSVVSELVAAGGRRLKVLATSRSPLHVYGELEFPVPSLAVPGRGGGSRESVANVEAVALFLQRASAVQPGFALTDSGIATVAEICARLDGLPLAIELAAARVKLLSPAAIKARLESRLQLLTGGARDLPVRQQTLRGAIDWSHGLLNEAEQRLFRRLSVFVGGCTLEAAEAVCNAREDLGLDVLDGMTSMVDKSLVQRVEPENAEPRFVMLETLREYALERLTEGGDEALARRAHAAYFLVLAEEESGGSAEAERAGWLDRCELEHANYRAALDWMIETDAAEWGLRLGSALFRFWDERDLLAEGRDRLARVLRLPKAAAYPKPRARALFAAGVLAGEQRDHESSESLWRESLAINRELGDEWGVGVVVNAMAVGALDRGDAPIARELLEENLVRWRQLGDRVAVARCVSNLANVAKTQGDHARARVLYDESREIFRSIGDRTGVAWALNSQGDLAREAGDSATARAYYEQSLASFREAGDRWGTAGALSDLGNLAREEGSHATADSLYRESLEIFLELAHQRGVARLLECFAVSAAAQSQPQRALRLAGAAAALRQSLGAPLARNEQERLETALVTARRALPDREGTAAWLEGWGLPIERSVEIASSGAA